MTEKTCRWCHRSNVIFDPDFLCICVDCGDQKRKNRIKTKVERGDTYHKKLEHPTQMDLLEQDNI